MEKRYGYITPDDYAKAAENGINARTVYQRVESHGWDIDRAVSEKPRESQSFDETWKRLKDVAQENGVTRSMLYHRIKIYKWPEEKAAATPKGCRCKRSMFTDLEKRQIIQSGLNLNVVRTRIRTLGWSKKRAINTPLITERERAIRAAEGTRAYHDRKRGEAR